MQVNIKHLVDDVQCYQTVRELRWPDGVACPSCESTQVIKRGFDDTEPARQRYECHDCNTRFDDLTDTIFAGHHQREQGAPGVSHARGGTLMRAGSRGVWAMSSSQEDYYKILQVDSAADPDIIAVAYKRLARKYHPDTNASPEATRRMQALNTAYQVLHDPGTRAQYDRERSAQASWSATREAEAPRHAPEDAEAARQRRTLTPGMVARWLVTWLVPLGLVLFLLGPLAERLVLPLVESPLLLVGVIGVLWLLRHSMFKQRHPHRPPRG